MAKVLIIEDDLVTRRIVSLMLSRKGHESVACSSAEEALEILDESFPILMVDVGLPGMNGLEFCRKVRRRSDGDRYFILVGTANSGIDNLREILDAGADDYISKPYQPDLLKVRLTIAERQVENITVRKRVEKELTFLAKHDPLTEMLNRSQLDPILRDTIMAVSKGEEAAVLYLDLDNFKVVNDTLGHDAGDRLLVEVSKLLKKRLRFSDDLIRFGGDEFVLILRNASEEVARGVAERIRQDIDDFNFSERGRTFRLGVSIGAVLIHSGHTPSTVLSEADAACYAAKARGRNRVEFHGEGIEITSRLMADQDWASRIRDGLLDGSIQIWLQPVVSTQGESIFHEVLTRYCKATIDDPFNPAAFLPAVNRSGQAQRYDRFVLVETVKLLAAYPKQSFSVNLFGSTLSDPDLPAFIAGICSRQKVDCRRLILEISENEIIASSRSDTNYIQGLQSLGCRVAMDDFGVGQCGLANLRNFPVDIVKIADTLTKNIASDTFNRTVIRAMVEVVKYLKCKTVAKFVQTPEEMEILESLGVDAFQGKLSGLAAPVGLVLKNQ